MNTLIKMIGVLLVKSKENHKKRRKDKFQKRRMLKAKMKKI
jgi:hypothetical protein